MILLGVLHRITSILSAFKEFCGDLVDELKILIPVFLRACVMCVQPAGTPLVTLMALYHPLAMSQPAMADAAQAQQQFQQGVQWLRQGKTDKATAVFEQLVVLHPGLVEAHNNLGVLYAVQGRLGDARQTLEAGLRASRSVGVLYQNLVDVQAHLARQGYALALQTDSWHLPAPRLRMLEGAAADKPSPVVQLVATPAPAVVQPVVPQAPAAVSDGARDAVRDAVQAWAKAWSDKDVARYLAAYAPSFVSADALPRSRWEAERRQRIESRKSISVTLRQLSVTVQGDEATAEFQQLYVSDQLSVTSRKRLTMHRQAGEWRIVREQVH